MYRQCDFHPIAIFRAPIFRAKKFITGREERTLLRQPTTTCESEMNNFLLFMLLTCCAAKLAEATVGLGLITSKSGGWTAPRPKART